MQSDSFQLRFGANPEPTETRITPASPSSLHSSSLFIHGAPSSFICKSRCDPRGRLVWRGKYLRVVTPNTQLFLFIPFPSIRGRTVSLMSIVPLKKHLVGLWCGNSTVFLLPSAVVEPGAGLNRWISRHGEPSCEMTDGGTCSIGALLSFLPLVAWQTGSWETNSSTRRGTCSAAARANTVLLIPPLMFNDVFSESRLSRLRRKERIGGGQKT